LDRVLVRMSDELGLPFDQFVVLLEEVLPEGGELRQVVAEAARAHGLPGEARRRELRDKLAVLQANLSALARYELRPYDGALTVFPAGMRSADDLSLGWKGLAAGGVDIRAVPGHHYTMLREPHVRALAEKLRASLDAPVETT
jgi:thioesterase domain-containing protein